MAFFENTKKKRRILKKYIYPLLRILPIRKKVGYSKAGGCKISL